MADSILERLIDNRIAALKTILKANGYEEDIGRTVYDGRQMNFSEPLPHSFWKLDEEIPQKGPIGRYRRVLGLWVGGAIEFAGDESWRKLLGIRADLQTVMGANFPLSVPVQTGGEQTIQVQVEEKGSNEPLVETSGSLRGYVEILYAVSYDTSRNDPGVH